MVLNMKVKIGIIISLIFILNLIVISKYYSKPQTTFKEQKNIFAQEKYYLEKNLDRYNSYYATHPDLKIKDIIAIVNVDADKKAYENNQKADVNKGNLILVNKYNYLEENYTPANLMNMSTKFAYQDKQTIVEVNEAFINMYNAALKDGVNFYITSAYRSFTYQKELYAKYLLNYGEDYTNTISARPGFSEHQTGLALDILSEHVQMSEFVNTKAYKWLKENSYKYGFILRYPENKSYITGYAFEPWHYRYLGEEIALKVYQENITYDEYYAYYLAN